MRRVIIESPFSGDILRNTAYARACLYHSLSIGEAPFASHLLYPQVLDEHEVSQRDWGIDAGLCWARTLTPGQPAPLVAPYTDFGISSGMQRAIEHASVNHIEVEFRTLPIDIMADFQVGRFNDGCTQPQPRTLEATIKEHLNGTS